MAQEIVLRKRERDGNKTCTVYNVSRSSYKFTLDTCDDVKAIFRDNNGQIVVSLTEDEPTVIISKIGRYNICIEGIGLGVLYVEYISKSDDVSECCEEIDIVSTSSNISISMEVV